MKLHILLPILCGIAVCCYDFFVRVHVNPPEVDEKDIASFTYKKQSKDTSNIGSFLEENFPVLVTQEKQIQAEGKAKRVKANSTKQVEKKTIIKVPPAFIKVAGIISKNDKTFVVLALMQSNQQKKIYTLQVGDTFPDGKVIDITALGTTIDVKGQRYSLPIFKDKNVKVEG